MKYLLQVALLLVATMLQLSQAWRSDRKPRIFGSKLRLKSLEPGKYRIQKKLVQFHNFFRSKVKPEASNMLAMSWSSAAAVDAQRWADACQLLVHDSSDGRTVEEYGACGQNIFVSTQQVPWFFAVKTWWLEKDNFTYGGSNNDLHVIGHYTQMVWHATHEVGCGLAYCPHASPTPFYNYVCNYCPMGNYMHVLSTPYERGPPCSACPGHCKAKKLCTNSCPYGDIWINCKELNAAYHDWLCNTKTKEGLERFRYCRATCSCKDAITFP
ncbi:cysteine-rich secretory protein 2-like [Penaeus japonicus]|uniref:cysteine-rich secretory protein 2-like n=1 Tax=Penaeus japonicus TaxID=27405 RepID=UPI001C70D43E|nr:cysteine-rich secretory protein 2-like [Penaeus japonicus]XP_042866364.1 cysteine-rich secretory protein 2-like [Penaeus japonicus]XP_042866365.1 cysteine-rich secretory protein 2-like [Penaeus japonicus]XP_042866367.1 cysteine-rich secretory protein 2-like [Penaeus japonicus]